MSRLSHWSDLLRSLKPTLGGHRESSNRTNRAGWRVWRALAAVTLVLNGQERFEDHLGTSGVARAGDVQWTRAGSGILHGGGPAGSERLHSLQLWLNLPAAQKHADPLTYHQIINR